MAFRDDVHVWAIEQVVALAGSSARFGAGEAVAVPSRWSSTGVSERGVWGRYHGTGAEPYDVAVDHVGVTARCTCPSRTNPCKHVVGLLVLWVRGHVAAGAEPAAVGRWIYRQRQHVGDRAVETGGGAAATGSAVGEEPAPAGVASDGDSERGERARDERIGRLLGGLVELDRWLEDRMRIGLADPSIARYATWDDVARRLTDARAGALANRVRRLAGRVGVDADWHQHVLAEIGVLHLLVQAGQRVPELPPDLADGVAVACGWQVRRADVEATVPETDRWLVAGRSDAREDLVEVRRVWLRGVRSGRWAMVLSFAAYRQALDCSLAVGTVVDADLHRYPGSSQRALLGEIASFDETATSSFSAATKAATDLAGACALVGGVLGTEPWLERVPVIVDASVTRGGQGWLLTDPTGSLAIAPEAASGDTVPTLLAATAGRPAAIAGEWTPRGIVPISVFLGDRTIDIGPRADPSFVTAA